MSATGSARLSDSRAFSEISRIVAERDITSLYQPIVDLQNGDLVGCEVLSRGPLGSELYEAGALFDAATKAGLLPDLDLLCRVLGLSRAAEATGDPGLVFVNVEPGDGQDLSMSDELWAILAAVPFQVVVEFTERALTRRPANLLRYSESVHARGNLVAIDDLGADPRSLALVPLLQPDICKLDMSVVQGTCASPGVTAAAAWEYADRTGAVLIAEGIETEEHRARAIALGATWGQGYLFGRPGPIEAIIGRPRSRHVSVPWGGAGSRSDPDSTNVEPAPTGRVASRLMLNLLSHQLEEHARRLGPHGVLLAEVEDASVLTPNVLDRYAAIAGQAALVGIVGPRVSDQPALAVHGGSTHSGSDSCGRWAVAVLGPHFGAALVAVPDAQEGCYRAVWTSDRAYVSRLAGRLARALAPTPARRDDRPEQFEIIDQAALAVTTVTADDPSLTDVYRSGWMRQDQEAYVLGADEGLSSLLGYSESELLGVHSLDLVHPGDSAVATDSWAETVARPGKGRRLRLRYRRADGEYVWCEVTHYNMLTDVRHGCVRSEFLDVHADVANEHELAAQQRTLHTLAETLPVGVVLVDKQGRIAYANRQLLSGVEDRTELTIQHLFAAVEPADRKQAEDAYQAALSTEQPVRVTVSVPSLGRGATRQFRIDINASGDGAAVACLTDVTADNRLQQLLEHQANRDSLTGCHNRAAILHEVKQALAVSDGGHDRRAGDRLGHLDRLDEGVAVLYIDLDGFKHINDRHGHAAGDAMLVRTSQRLRRASRKTDTLGRLGGDEFLLLCRNVADRETAERLAEQVRAALATENPIAASVGVAWTGDTTDVDDLVAQADMDMYRIKRLRRTDLPTRPADPPSGDPSASVNARQSQPQVI